MQQEKVLLQRVLTSRVSSCGDSLVTSATKASLTAGLLWMRISLAAVSTRSRSAPQVGHVLASGSSVGAQSHTPLSTACTNGE